MGLDVGHELLPEPHRHVLERIDAKGIESQVQPGHDGRLDIVPEIDIAFVERGKSQHLVAEQLEFIFPVGDRRIMVIELIVVVVKIRQRGTVVGHHPLAPIQFGGAVIADDVQHDLQAPLVQGVDHAAEGFAGMQGGGFTQPNKVGIHALEILRPVAVHRPIPMFDVVHLLEQG